MGAFENDRNSGNVAVIGMAGRFPGAPSARKLWKVICDGRDTINRFRYDELHPSVSEELKKNPMYVRARGILEGLEDFDERFFRISPREAEIMDPQHRLFLEIAWEALEDGGYNPETYEGLIGVYGGAGVNTYFINNILPQNQKMMEYGEHQTSIANAPDYITSRISYKFNMRGPSVSLYTGCSLSLVAVCFAFEALQSYQCDLALAGGVFVHCPQESGYVYKDGEIYSRDGYCRPFDAQAKGTVFSNGGAIVVLKRLQEAIQDRDNIYAVIRGAALNNDGSQKVSFLAPGVSGQTELIAMAQANARVHPESISYIETHGTGTSVGDPIEFEALTRSFRLHTMKKGYCAIGAIKANIGHLDAAAGIAGLVKTSLMLKHGLIPPLTHFEENNPNIDFENSPFYINRSLKEWKTDGAKRRAGVSSFGVGGTNAHVILEEAPERELSSNKRQWHLVTLSAMSKPAVEKLTSHFIEYAKENNNKLSDACNTLQVGRKHFSYRSYSVCRTWGDAIANLSLPDGRPPEIIMNQSPVPVFMFSGQGAQYPNMGLGLYRLEPVFRDAIDRCSDLLLSALDCDLRSILYPEEENINIAGERLKQTRYTQPALFTIEYAIAELLISWGIRPKVMVGHSIGEYVAAYMAGVFTLEDVLSVVALRGRLMQELPRGSMIAVFLSEDEVGGYLDMGLSLAAVNSPSLCTISGDKDVINNLKQTFSRNNIDFRDLQTSHAFHSTMVEPILNQFGDYLAGVTLNPPNIPFLSNLTGTYILDQEATDPTYWRNHLRGTVRFADCIQNLLSKNSMAFIETGPGRTLCSMTGMQAGKQDGHIVLATMRHPKEDSQDEAFLLDTLGRLWQAGLPVDWTGLGREEIKYRVSLPTYPFERRRHWIDFNGNADHPRHKKMRALDKCDEKTPSYIEEKKEVLTRQKNQQIPYLNNIMQEVARIWEDVLGVRDVRASDNFFDLGGSSVMAAMLFAKIEKVFGKRFPLSTLYSASTVAKMAEIIRNGGHSPSWSSLVEIQSNGSRPPLFLVHGAGGNVLLYRDLARCLGDEQPVYGLQSLGLDGKMPFLKTVEAMARHYIEEILSSRISGPYIFGGYCMGGSVAYEMARMMVGQNNNVALVVMLETYNFSNIPHQTMYSSIYQYIEKSGFHVRNFLLLPFRDRLIFVKEKVKVANSRKKVFFGMIATKINPKFENGNREWLYLSKLWKNNDNAAYNYIPKNYSGNLIQFLPAKEYSHHSGPALSWDNLVSGRLEKCRLNVFPGGMLMEPFVQILAKKIGTSIDTVLEGPRRHYSLVKD